MCVVFAMFGWVFFGFFFVMGFHFSFVCVSSFSFNLPNIHCDVVKCIDLCGDRC